MPVPDAVNQTLAFLAAIETNYGVAAALNATTDTVLPYLGDGDPPAPTPVQYLFGGNIGRSPAVLGPQRNTTPAGRFREGEIPVLVKGLGSPYSASAFPPNEFDRLIRAAGFDRVFSATPSARHIYTPTPAGLTYASLTLRQFAQGDVYDHVGVLCDVRMETQELGVPLWTFPYKGIMTALPAAGAMPALTPQAPLVIPPVAQAIVANIGAWTGVGIRAVRFRLNRTIESARMDMTAAGGHLGWVPAGMRPELELELERPARGTFNPEAEFNSATSRAVSVEFAAGANNRYTIAFPQAQLANSPAPGAAGSLATVTLVFRAFASTPTSNDFLTITQS
jgi:hypothetical protein